MELFNFSQINHHSFMRWSAEQENKNKKDERNETRVFDPMSLPEDSMDREFMVTALSA